MASNMKYEDMPDKFEEKEFRLIGMLLYPIKSHECSTLLHSKMVFIQEKSVEIFPLWKELHIYWRTIPWLNQHRQGSSESNSHKAKQSGASASNSRGSKVTSNASPKIIEVRMLWLYYILDNTLTLSSALIERNH